MIRSSTVALLSSALFFSLAGCGQPTETVANPVTFDPCQPLTVTIEGSASDAQRAGVAGALALWNESAGTHLTLAGATPTDAPPADGAPTLPLEFQAAAAPFHGFYDPAAGQVYINSDLVGAPEQVTIAHEIGHAFGLAHVSGRQSVMNSSNVTIEPNAGDVAALAGMWGACSPTTP